MRGYPWGIEREGQLRKLVEQGLSSRQVADELGVTKNMVIGKARRLRLRWRLSPKWSRFSPKRIVEVAEVVEVPVPSEQVVKAPVGAFRRKSNYGTFVGFSPLGKTENRLNLEKMLAEAAKNTRKLQENMPES